MKYLSKLFRILYALIIGLLSCSVVLFIAYLIYDYRPDFIGQILFCLFSVFGLFVFYKTALTAFRLGILKFLSVNHSSPDLDNLQPVPGDSRKLLSAQDLVRAYANKELSFTTGKLKIWGDWRGRSLEATGELTDLNYIQESDTLIFRFAEDKELIIQQPRKIILARTYLKIVQATQVNWHLNSDTYFEYICHNRKVEMTKNGHQSVFDSYTSIVEPAVMLLTK